LGGDGATLCAVRVLILQQSKWFEKTPGEGLSRGRFMTGLNLLVTGRPGVGKTTLLESVSAQLRGSLRLAGFTTAEVRDPSGHRTGFRILTVEGKEAELARVGFRSSIRVGR
jgi:Cdc6-like AAA superfamily ATPase